MIFYYERNTDRHILATNIRAVSEFSGISYHKIRGWFTNGSGVYKDDEILCISAEVIRGKQRLVKKELPLSDYQKERIEKMIEEKKVFPMTDQTGPGCPIGPTGESGPIGDPGLPKRETVQPGSRDMSEYDDFFKQVGEKD